MAMKNIGVLGCGTWGMALARMLCNMGHSVTDWSAIPEEIDACSSTRRHKNLPGMVIPNELQFTKNLQELCTGRDLLLFAIPSVFVRNVARNAAPFIPDGQVMVNVAKGVEPGTHLTITEVLEDEIKKDGKHDHIRVASLSGPTHAEEVALDMPTTIVSAAKDHDTACFIQDIFMNPRMRVYTNDDTLGVELCGALKNIIALASGISTGLGNGDNAKAALITRGLAEITRLGLAMGCKPATFSGLAGVGDLIVTATSMHSRNNRCGILIGQGKSPEEAVKEVQQCVEGINALPAAMELSAQYHIEMPICSAVNDIINNGVSPASIGVTLMGRSKKRES